MRGKKPGPKIVAIAEQPSKVRGIAGSLGRRRIRSDDGRGVGGERS